MTRISVVQSEFERCEIIQNHIFLSNQIFLSEEKKLHLQNLAKHPIFHIVNFEFIYGIKCVGELIAYTVET